MTRYDAVVIGGGLGGLTSTALLAKRGLRVLLLEARERLGGLTSTEELALGVSGDVVDHELGWIPETLVAELGLARHGLQLLRPDPIVSAVPAPGVFITLQRDPRQTAAALARFSPRDAAAWPDFARRVAHLSGFLQALYERPAPSLFRTGAGNLVTLLRLGRKARSLGRSGIFDLLRTLPMSIADVLDETFEGAALKGLLASRAVTRILQGPRSGATAFLFLHHHVGVAPGAILGCTTARGGVGAMAAALAASARAHGADIRTGAAVALVDVRADRVRGVVLESGEEIAADIVVSSLDPRRTIHDLVQPECVEPELSRAIGNVRLRGATAKVNLVLEGPLPLPNAGRDIGDRIVLAPSMAYLERAFDRAKHGAVSDEPFVEFRFSEPGVGAASTLRAASVLLQWAPYRLKGSGWDNAARDRLGDLALHSVERVLPGFSERVVSRQVLSPLDIEQHYGASDGSLTHGELALDQILFMRPVPSLSRYRSQGIEGLYLCGRGCHPGMPVPAAQLAVREIAQAHEPAAAPPAA